MAAHSLAAFVGQFARDNPNWKIFSSGAETFDETAWPAPLKEGQANRILLYPGAFNPPHLGHLETLREGFLKGGDGLNLVAAFIFHMDDYSLKKKLKREKEDDIFAFTRAERSQLWRAYPDLPPWTWIVDGWAVEFQSALGEWASAFGLEIIWVLLLGADHPPRGFPIEGPTTYNYGCQELIISDKGKAFAARDLSSEDNFPIASGYWNWKLAAPSVYDTELTDVIGSRYRYVKSREEDKRRFCDECLLKEKALAQSDDATSRHRSAEAAPTSQLHSMVLGTETPALASRQLPSSCDKCLMIQNAKPFRGICSTAVRKVMMQKKGDELVAELKTIVLSSGVLVALWEEKLRGRNKKSGYHHPSIH